MSRANKEGVISRWSRLKRESARAANEAEASPDELAVEVENELEKAGEADRPPLKDEPLTKLPSLDELGPESDFEGFMKPDVDDALRRAALKRLFSDPHFNVTDGLDVYAEDYTQLESMTPAMVAGLKHAQRLLFGNTNGDEQADTASAAGSVNQPANEATAALQDEVRTERTQDREGEEKQQATGEAGDGGQEENAELKPAATDDTDA